jgi:hypothetical protein
MSLLTRYLVRRIDCWLLEQQGRIFRSTLMRDSREAGLCFILIAAAWHVFGVDNYGWILTLTYPGAS